jgi:penicillin-binding protein 1A
MNGYSPCWPVQDVQYTIPAGDPNFGLMESWSPANANGEFTEEMYTLKDALRKSLNSVSTWLISKLGSTDEIIQLAENMGIGKNKIPHVPSIALGVPSLNVLEMTSAYSTFSNDGIHSQPILIQRIENKRGETIYESKIEQNRALSKEYNHVMVELLKYASSSVHFALLTDFGGKTGTTNDYVDGWFVGIMPNLTVGTWVGGDDPWIRFLTLEDGQGGVMARPYFLHFMQSVEKDKDINYNTNAKFLFPGNLGIELDCDKYYETKGDSLLQDTMVTEELFDELFDNNLND